MTAKSTDRGHKTRYSKGGWIYSDTGEPVGMSRPCKNCKQVPGSGGIDPCIATLIKTLNDAGLRTVASCCEHGKRNGNIMLEDGREVLIAPDYDTARRMEKAIVQDISGRVIATSESGLEINLYNDSDGVLHVSCDGTLIIKPRASNSVELDVQQ